MIRDVEWGFRELLAVGSDAANILTLFGIDQNIPFRLITPIGAMDFLRWSVIKKLGFNRDSNYNTSQEKALVSFRWICDQLDVKQAHLMSFE